jgi:hypothetical protein
MASVASSSDLVGDEDDADLGVPLLRHFEEAHAVHPVRLELGDDDLRAMWRGLAGRWGSSRRGC